MYAATRQTGEGYSYNAIGDGSQYDLARLAGGGLIHAYIVRGTPADAPMGLVEGDHDESPVLAEGWYDASDQDQSPEDWARDLFLEAKGALGFDD